MTPQPRQSESTEPRVRLVCLPLCDLCLDGAGGECHVPGCALWMKSAPDVEIRSSVDRPAQGMVDAIADQEPFDVA